MKSVVANARENPGGGGPFCWQSVFVVRHLREVGESAQSISVSSILGVYLALTELATDNHEATFRVTVSEIAGRAGLGYRTTGTALRLIEEAGMLHVRNNFLGDGAIKTSNTYTLLQHDASICKFCLSHGEGRKFHGLPKSVEDRGEERKEERASPPPFNEVTEAWIMRAEKEFPERADIPSIAKKFFRHYENKPRARCYERLAEWIRDERNPKNRHPEKIEDSGPEGWQEYLQRHYPIAEYPTREIYEKGSWARVPLDFKKLITDALKQVG